MGRLRAGDQDFLLVDDHHQAVGQLVKLAFVRRVVGNVADVQVIRASQQRADGHAAPGCRYDRAAQNAQVGVGEHEHGLARGVVDHLARIGQHRPLAAESPQVAFVARGVELFQPQAQRVHAAAVLAVEPVEQGLRRHGAVERRFGVFGLEHGAAHVQAAQRLVDHRARDAGLLAELVAGGGMVLQQGEVDFRLVFGEANRAEIGQQIHGRPFLAN